MSESFRSKVRTTLTGLLPRLRHSLPFPLDPKEVYRAAFPESKLADWLYDPLPTDLHRRGLAYRNLVSCTIRQPVVYFCLNSQEELDQMTDDSDRALFWLRFPRHVVGPSDLGSFMLSDAMRGELALICWYNDAVALEESIDLYTQKVYKAVKEISNPSEFALAWPEVASAVPGIVPPKATLRAAARSHRIPALRQQVLTHFPLGDGNEMDKFTSMLATALMLPAVQFPSAWVGILSNELDLEDYR